MIGLVQVEVRGESAAGSFKGVLDLRPGLQVVSGPNAFGKSLAARAVAWCLGLEPLLGVQDNDPSCLPLAARDEADFGSGPTRILGSECSVLFEADDGRTLRLSRDIQGERTTVRVAEKDAKGTTRQSVLQARLRTMGDEHGGLQRFLFEWMGWPRAQVATFSGSPSEVYLENLAPLFYVEQDEGWTDIQARQIGRYGQLQISQVAVEYLLGAVGAVNNRFARQQAIQVNAALRDRARVIADQVTALFTRRGWAVTWSGHGSVPDILARWSVRLLKDALMQQAEVDLATQRARLIQTADALQRTLTTETIDPTNVSAHTEASQRVITLKERRHELSAEMRGLRVQNQEATELLDSLDHRLQSASDVLRLKTTGIGRMDEVECPTCHRHLDPATFSLSAQGETGIREHIKALKRDRELIGKNVEALNAQLTGLHAEAARIDSEFREAERALVTVTAAVGTVREQLAQTAAKLAATGREIDRLDETAAELDSLQKLVNEWIADARKVQEPKEGDADLQSRLQVFTDALRVYLVALGHSAVPADKSGEVHLDEQYVVYLGARRLQSLGSASDRPRLVAAFSLALAAASQQVNGLHPGIVILDEPFQQNPDDPHRDLYSKFLSEELALHAKFQVVILTSLRDAEIASLRTGGTEVVSLEGHFLELEPPPQPAPKADKPVPPDEEGEARAEGSGGPNAPDGQAEDEVEDEPKPPPA